MIYRIFLLLVIFSTLTFSQKKYFVYFKDKIIKPGESLNKENQYYKTAIEELSERAIQRRIKNMGQDIISFEDIPINKNYIEVLKSSGIEIIHELKWFNSVSAKLDESQIAQIKDLNFVDRIDPVKRISFRKTFVDDLTLNKEESTY